MEQILIEQRELLLVPFPFSDQSGKKVRPVIVVSNNNFNKHSEDVIVIGVTSNMAKDIYTIELNTEDLEEGNLFDICCVKVENILKLDKQLIIKKMGKVKKWRFKEIILKLDSILEMQ